MYRILRTEFQTKIEDENHPGCTITTKFQNGSFVIQLRDVKGNVIEEKFYLPEDYIKILSNDIAEASATLAQFTKEYM